MPPIPFLVSTQSVVFLNIEDCSSSIALFFPLTSALLALLLLLLPYVELEEDACISFEKSVAPVDDVPLNEVSNEPVFTSCKQVSVDEEDNSSSCRAISACCCEFACKK